MKPSALATVLIRFAALFLAIHALIATITIGLDILVFTGGLLLFAVLLWHFSRILGLLIAHGLE